MAGANKQTYFEQNLLLKDLVEKLQSLDVLTSVFLFDSPSLCEFSIVST